MQPSVVEPVDPLEGGQLYVVKAAPGPAATDKFGLEEPDQALRRGVVEGVAPAADGANRTGGGQPLGVAHGQVLASPCGSDE